MCIRDSCRPLMVLFPAGFVAAPFRVVPVPCCAVPETWFLIRATFRRSLTFWLANRVIFLPPSYAISAPFLAVVSALDSISETIIQHAVCDLVAQFVGMPFRHRFGRIKSFHSHILLYRSLLPRCWSRGLSFPFSSYRSGRAAGIAQLIIEPHIIAACCALETPRI